MKRIVAEFEVALLRVGVHGYCLPCDYYGWAWPHRKHGACWRGTPVGRAWQRRIQAAVNRQREAGQ